MFARFALARLSRPANPDDRRHFANPETLGGDARRTPRQRGVDHAITQILAISPRHQAPHR
ncbi:MAG: hypothetical protein CTY15_13155 [Methylocystis sp.]|nr:MAG: hypothetical protein CTY15_13155 [Methylocystis sp.]